MKPPRIPIFPLELVLFPGSTLPLHIFEPRYKQMIRECQQQHLEFGVVLAHDDGVASVGCTAAIVEVFKQYSDGRMDILAAGRVPFRATELFDEKPYLEAAVEYLVDQPAAAVLPAQAQLVSFYEQCYSVIHGRPPHRDTLPGGSSLSYQIAADLPLALEFKQELLELRSEEERQQSLLEKMQKWLPELQQLNRARSKAGGNGHTRA